MNAPKWMMVGGGAATILGGVLLWRGWVRYKKCSESLANVSEGDPDVACRVFNVPMAAGAILAPIGLGTFTVGGALALIKHG